MKIFQPQPFPPAFSTLTRASTATFINGLGVLSVAANDVLRYQDGLPLVEQAATNLATHSQNFGAWSAGGISNMTVTTGVADPFGGTAAARLTSTAANNLFQQAVVVTAGVTLTGSFWVRRHTGAGAVNLRVGDGTAYPIEVSSDWRRVAITAVASTTTGRLGIVLSVSGDAVEIFGAQLETGAVMTSYIPTTTAAVTRAADVVSVSSNASGGAGSAGGYLLVRAPNGADVPWTATTWTDGIRVAYGGKLWKLAAGQTAAGTDVPGVSPKWLLIGPDNRTAWFDGEINSSTSSLIAAVNYPIGFLLSLESDCNAILVSGIDKAKTLRITISSDLYSPPFFDQTVTVEAGQQYLRSQYLVTGFTAPAGSVLRVGLTGGSLPVAVGLVAWGQTQDTGCAEWGARAGIKDYSRTEADDFGQVVFVRRAFAKTVSASVRVAKAEVNTVHDRLTNLRATPAVWIFSDDADYAVPLVVFGFFKDFYTTFPRLNDIQCALEIQGLT